MSRPARRWTLAFRGRLPLTGAPGWSIVLAIVLASASLAQGAPSAPAQRSGSGPHDRTRVENASGPPTWSNATAIVRNAPPGTAGPFREVFDPVINATLLVAGDRGPVTTWTYSNGSYIQLSPPLSPSTGSGGPLGFDSAMEAPVLLATGSTPAVVWTYQNDSWSLLATSGNGPSGNPAEAGQWVNDPSDGVMLFFDWGGTAASTYFWELAGRVWTNLTGSEPPPDLASVTDEGAPTEVMTYDYGSERVLLFGGPSENGSSTPSGATWEFHLGTWSRVCTLCGPWGGGLSAESTTYDTSLDEVVAFGSSELSLPQCGRAPCGNETWAYAGSNWTVLRPNASPPSLAGSIAVDDARDGDLLLFGGSTTPGANASVFGNGTWQFGWPPIPTYPVQFLTNPVGTPAIEFNHAIEGNGTTVWVTNGTYGILPAPDGRSDGGTGWMHFEAWNVFGGVSLLGTDLVVNGSGGTVVADFLPFPQVQFLEDGCGPVMFNGTAYSNGTSDHFLTSGNPFPLNASLCTAFAFVGWVVHGDVTVGNASATNTTANVTGNGSVSALYGVIGGGPVIDGLSARPSTLYVGNLTQISAEVSGGVSALSLQFTGLPGNCTAINAYAMECRPELAGVYVVGVRVSDANGSTARSSTTVIVLPSSAPPAITSFVATPNVVTVDQVTEFVVGWALGTPPITFYYSGLPAGCESISTSIDPCIPTQTGSFLIRVTVADSLGRQISATTPLLIRSAPASNAPSFLSDPFVYVSLGAGAIIVVILVERRVRRRPPPASLRPDLPDSSSEQASTSPASNK